MEATGISTAELEAALGGLYTAPGDPDAPDLDEPDPTPVDEVPLPASSPGFTVADMQATLGDMYTAPSLEEAA
jgi:hypothetical protein